MQTYSIFKFTICLYRQTLTGRQRETELQLTCYITYSACDFVGFTPFPRRRDYVYILPHYLFHLPVQLEGTVCSRNWHFLVFCHAFVPACLLEWRVSEKAISPSFKKAWHWWHFMRLKDLQITSVAGDVWTWGQSGGHLSVRMRQMNNHAKRRQKM